MTGQTDGMDIKKMTSTTYQYRRKATKQIRVIYTDRDGSVTIDKIGPRGDVYKK